MRNEIELRLQGSLLSDWRAQKAAQTSRVPHVSFPPSACHIYHIRLRVSFGLRLIRQPYPHT